MRFIITGFEPFGSHTYNPSSCVAAHLHEALAEAGAQSTWEELPVTFACARDFASTRAIHPEDIVIHIGLAASRAHISLEARAHNCQGTSPDNLGQSSRTGTLSPGDAPEQDTRLDLARLAQAIERADEHDMLPEVRVTYDAGDYVCNAIYYHTLAHTSRAVFIHVPNWSPEQARGFARALASALLSWHAELSP